MVLFPTQQKVIGYLRIFLNRVLSTTLQQKHLKSSYSENILELVKEYYKSGRKTMEIAWKYFQRKLKQSPI